MDRPGPGLLLRDLLRGGDDRIAALIRVLVALDGDILLLTAFDYDLGAEALAAFADFLAAAGLSYPYRMALRPNTGIATGLDLDGDGRLGGPGDAQGFGAFPGQNGMVILSRLPLIADRVTDLSALLWRDLPGGIPPAMGQGQAAVQRLSTGGHWIVPVRLPDGRPLSLLAWYATPPVFGGPGDVNARRNHDETALWLRLIGGDLPMPPPAPPFVLIGDANLDPVDGAGRKQALRSLLAHPALRDPRPRGRSDRQDPGQRGDPAEDTVVYTGKGAPGGLRVDYILPSADLQVAGAGVLAPADGKAEEDGDRASQDLRLASRHHPVWLDLVLP